MVERIQKIIQHKKLSASGFADAIGVPRSTISHILSGRNNPSLEFVLKVLDAYPDIRMEWLILGKGYMLHAASGSLFPDEDDILLMPSPKETKQPENARETDQQPQPETHIGSRDESGGSDMEAASRAHGQPLTGSDEAATGSNAGTATGPNEAAATQSVAASTIETHTPATAKALSGREISRVMVFYTDGSFSAHHPASGA